MLNILLDTNVLIDVYTNRSSGDALSGKLLIMKAFGDARFWASAQSFADIYYVEHKIIDGERIQRAFEKSSLWLDICSVDAHDIYSAASRKWPDFEDCLIDIAAQKVKADYLLTRNTRDFARSACTVLTPTDFFDLLESEHGLVYDVVDFDPVEGSHA